MIKTLKLSDIIKNQAVLNVGCIGGVKYWADNGLTTGILGGRDDDKIRVVQFFINMLPHGHIKLASSP